MTDVWNGKFGAMLKILTSALMSIGASGAILKPRMQYSVIQK